MFTKPMQYRHTNHFIHFILTLLTSGLWIIPWVIIACCNSSHNDRCDQQWFELMHRDNGPQTIIIEHRKE